MEKSIVAVLSAWFMLSLLFSGCSSAAATDAVTLSTATAAPVQAASPTEAPEPTLASTPTDAPPQPCMIAFDSDRDGNREVYLMGPDGAGLVNLSNDPAEDRNPSWAPDGSQIAFVSNRENGEEGGQFIYVMGADGRNVRPLTIENGSDWPGWSPDGSQIAYAAGGDIFVMNADGSGSSTNLTNSEEKDIRPDWSPDSRQIVWLSGSEGNWNIFVMNADGSNVRQLTEDGKVSDAVWTVDGQIFTHWDHPEAGCFNCVMNADGSNVMDVGGKGKIQRYLPFWTADGNRVELNAADVLTGDNEIVLVSDMYPDVFLNLTNNPADDKNPDWPAHCGPGSSASIPHSDTAQAVPSESSQEMVIGYEGDKNTMSPQKIADLTKACNELQIQCVAGESISKLAEQGVDAILSFSNQFHVLGSAPEIWDAAGKGIPVLILNAETDVPDAYNLTVDSYAVRASVEWMFKEMGGEGEFVYYNFGENPVHQAVIEEVAKGFPGIKVTAIPVSYDGNSVTEEGVASLVESNPNLKAIWANNQLNKVFWGVDKIQDDRIPLTLCEAKQDMFQTWKERLEARPSFQCYSSIQPGGTAYEGVYVAYYLLTGEEIDPAALSGIYGNTFLYDYLVVTNDNLDEWLGKIGELQKGDGGTLELPPMSPDAIKEKWFVE